MIFKKKRSRGILYIRYIFGNHYDAEIIQKFKTTDPIWRYNKNKWIYIKFGTRRFSRSLMPKLEIHEYHKILIW